MPIIEFDTKMRGYDPQQVNDAVTNFQDTINKYAQANTDLKRTLDTVNNQFTQANQDIDQLQAENKKLSERNSKSRTTIWKQKSRTSTRAWATM